MQKCERAIRRSQFFDDRNRSICRKHVHLLPLDEFSHPCRLRREIAARNRRRVDREPALCRFQPSDKRIEEIHTGVCLVVENDNPEVELLFLSGSWESGHRHHPRKKCTRHSHLDLPCHPFRMKENTSPTCGIDCAKETTNAASSNCPLPRSTMTPNPRRSRPSNSNTADPSRMPEPATRLN